RALDGAVGAEHAGAEARVGGTREALGGKPAPADRLLRLDAAGAVRARRGEGLEGNEKIESTPTGDSARDAERANVIFAGGQVGERSGRQVHRKDIVGPAGERAV